MERLGPSNTFACWCLEGVTDEELKIPIRRSEFD